MQVHCPSMNYRKTFFMEYVNNLNMSHPSLIRWVYNILHSSQPCYIPINHSGIHWLYLKVKPEHCCVYQHDSLPQLTREDYTQQLCDLLNQHSPSKWTGVTADTPHQSNSFDCGVNVIAHIFNQLQGHKAPPIGSPSRTLLRDILQTQTLPSTLYSPGPHIAVTTEQPAEQIPLWRTQPNHLPQSLPEP